MFSRSIKSMTRQYRKSLNRIGVKDLPHRGAFHLTTDKGRVIRPENAAAEVVGGINYRVNLGGIPVGQDDWKTRVYAPIPEDSIFADVAPDYWTPPTVYKKIVREPKREGDKRRIDYREVKNPKPGQECYVKLLKGDGKYKWTLTTFGANLAEMQVA